MGIDDKVGVTPLQWEIKDKITEGIEPPEFCKFPKIARFSREIVVTEKLDGTMVFMLGLWNV